MASTQTPNEDDFELLEIAESQMNALKRIFSDVSKTSAAKQIAIGGGTGIVSGYLVGRIGRSVLVFTGGALLLLQLAHHKGYVRLNWGQVERDARNIQRKLKNKAEGYFKSKTDSVVEFVKQNMFLTGGFISGVLIGLGL